MALNGVMGDTQITVVDISGNPIQGANVTFFDYPSKTQIDTSLTSQTGLALIYYFQYGINANFSISKPGYVGLYNITSYYNAVYVLVHQV